ncbi:hypothetical protein CONPUDRAFT_151206 [Coniophora puteana RWD-64-598 SS2]|uniref:Uncharacterized protein n=1 Tax=Coniophora puteana (strain RWD-64-598) TaxID=741705 RepID=A0A5M3MZW1_CONPW|nr:uncharacterized protein CONPUDRAFT_151206 [Coniophora puteana RWD-64-598 SS2]EIW84171.1 hypothetical protein CONPUDRAFT_151206 [Coniophora puteana RWD-64-598 SS2]
MLNKHLPVNYNTDVDNKDLAAMESDDYSKSGMFEDGDAGIDEVDTLVSLAGMKSHQSALAKSLRLSAPRLADKRFDVRTCWNSTHAMMEHALALHRAINMWVSKCDELSTEFSISPDDWKQITTLHVLLQPFTTTTRLICTGQDPTLPWVLPSYVTMQEHLEMYIHSNDFGLDIRKAAATGKAKLTKYYEFAKGCQHNTLAVGV